MAIDSRYLCGNKALYNVHITFNLAMVSVGVSLLEIKELMCFLTFVMQHYSCLLDIHLMYLTTTINNYFSSLIVLVAVSDLFTKLLQ